MIDTVEKIRLRLNMAIYSYEISNFIAEHNLYALNETIRHIYGDNLRNVIITLNAIFELKNTHKKRKPHLSLDQLINDLPSEYQDLKTRFNNAFHDPEADLYKARTMLFSARNPIAHALDVAGININIAQLSTALTYAEGVMTDLLYLLAPLENGEEYSFEITHNSFKSSIQKELGSLFPNMPYSPRN